MGKFNINSLSLFLIISILCLKCHNETYEPNKELRTSDLNEQGILFMKQFQKNNQWEYYWNSLNANGTLEVNSSFMNHTEDYGIHYLVPINNSDGFVNEIIVFPFDFTSDNGDGIIPLKDPICIKNTHPSTLSLQKLLGNFTTYWKLQGTGFSFAQDFLPEIQGVISRTGEKTITFQIYFTLDGENQTPWRNDIEFLISLLNIHEIVFTQCPYNYYMIMGDNCITVSFYNLPGNISYQNVLPYMDKLLSQLEFSLPEVQVSNPHSPWATSESPYPEFNLDNGAYIDNPLQSVPSRLGELISPQRPSPGDFYKFRNGSDFIPDYIPHDGNIDSTNAQCVIIPLPMR